MRPSLVIRSVTPDARLQNRVGHAERIGERRLFVATRNRFWFGITIQRVHNPASLRYRFGLTHAVRAFEVERFHHHADREDTGIAASARDNGALRPYLRAPPIPAVMNAMLEPARYSIASSMDSSAAFCPISGFTSTRAARYMRAKLYAVFHKSCLRAPAHPCSPR